MKKILLKAFMLVMLMCISVGAWADEETYNFASFTSGQDVELNATNFTITLHKGTGTNNPAWSSNQARVYANGSLEISSQKTITKIVYSYVINANKSGKAPSIDGVAGSTNAGSWDSETKTWTGSDTDVTLSTSGEAGNVGFTSVTVTYENAAGKETTTLSWSAATATVTIDADDNVFPTLTTTPVGLTGVTYSSSNAEAATINATTGAITLVGAGATTITASYAGDATHYAAADVSYNLTVKAAPVVDGYTHDALTNADFAADGTTYKDFSNVNKNTAVYAGNSSKNNGIQLRSSNNNSGIVSTTSGGKIKKIVVTWNSNCASGRTLDVYGKNTAYTAASDLYNDDNKGTKLGSIVKGTSTELTVTGDYEFVGVRSSSGALNMDAIEFVWEESTPAPTATIDFYAAGEDGYYTTFSNEKAVTIPEMVEIDDAVAQFTVYTVWVDGNDLVLMDKEVYEGEYYLSENEGYLIKAEYSGNIEYTGEAVISVEYTELDYELNGQDDENVLRPASEAKTGNNKYYMLAYSDDTCTPASLGFYWGAANGAAFDSRANSAYLALPKDTQARGFSFSNTEAIESIEMNAATTTIYTLNGVKVNELQKGLNIVNGKKVMVK